MTSVLPLFFFFSSRRRHTRSDRDWSSDVCSSDLLSFPYFVDEYDPDFPSKRLGKGLTEYVLRTGQALLATPELHQELEQRGEVELIEIGRASCRERV